MRDTQPLAKDYPVFYDYLYIAELPDNTFVKVRSDVQGTVNDLIKDLEDQGYTIINIYKYHKGG